MAAYLQQLGFDSDRELDEGRHCGGLQPARQPPVPAVALAVRGMVRAIVRRHHERVRVQVRGGECAYGARPLSHELSRVCFVLRDDPTNWICAAAKRRRDPAVQIRGPTATFACVPKSVASTTCASHTFTSAASPYASAPDPGPTAIASVAISAAASATLSPASSTSSAFATFPVASAVCRRSLRGAASWGPDELDVL